MSCFLLKLLPIIDGSTPSIRWIYPLKAVGQLYNRGIPCETTCCSVSWGTTPRGLDTKTRKPSNDGAWVVQTFRAFWLLMVSMMRIYVHTHTHHCWMTLICVAMVSHEFYLYSSSCTADQETLLRHQASSGWKGHSWVSSTAPSETNVIQEEIVPP